MQLVEKVLQVLDWILAFIFFILAALTGAVGVLFGLLTYMDKGNLGGHGGTLTFALVWLILGGLLVAAALGMRARASWRWYVQILPLFVYAIGWSVAVCVSGSAVVVGPWEFCGK